jgi:hypothetical protein
LYFSFQPSGPGEVQFPGGLPGLGIIQTNYTYATRPELGFNILPEHPGVDVARQEIGRLFPFATPAFLGIGVGIPACLTKFYALTVVVPSPVLC